MRKVMVALSVLILGIVFCSTTATAQTGISLSASSTSGITFTPTGSGNESMVAGVFGSAAGLGGLLGTTGFYTLSGGPVALTLGPEFSPFFAEYTASATPLSFDITSLPGGMGTDLLNGTLSLVDFAQMLNSGISNTSAVVDMTVTSGTLMADYPGNKGTSQLTINLTGLGFLPNLATATATNLRSATLDALVTPEPRSILLYGTGLVLFGIMLRRRLTVQS